MPILDEDRQDRHVHGRGDGRRVGLRGLEDRDALPLLIRPPPNEDSARQQGGSGGKAMPVDPPPRARRGGDPLIERGRNRATLCLLRPGWVDREEIGPQALATSSRGDLRAEARGETNDLRTDVHERRAATESQSSSDGAIPAITSAAEVCVEKAVRCDDGIQSTSCSTAMHLSGRNASPQSGEPSRGGCAALHTGRRAVSKELGATGSEKQPQRGCAATGTLGARGAGFACANSCQKGSEASSSR